MDGLDSFFILRALPERHTVRSRKRTQAELDEELKVEWERNINLDLEVHILQEQIANIKKAIIGSFVPKRRRK